MSKVTVSQRLVSHVRGKNREELTTRFIENRDLLERIRIVLGNDLAVSRRYHLDRESFRNPEWANQAAYEFGYQKALTEVINLLELRTKDE